MAQLHQRLILLVAAVVGVREAVGFSRYALEIPNVGGVRHFGVTWSTLGHPSQGGGTSSGAANSFGSDVLAADGTGGDLWPKVCELDSDGDGVKNKFELCDPACAWRPGDADPTDCRTDEVLGNEAGLPTHPGFADGVQADGAINPALIHGGMMILAWLVCAPIGILSATLFKKSDDPPYEWFPVHRAMLTMASFLTLVAWVVMIVNFGFALDNLHTQVGLAVVVLAVIQPISGALRPHVSGGQKEAKRIYWEAGHQWVGRLLTFLAAGACITGIQIGFANLEAGYVIAVVFAIITFGSFVYVLGFRDVPDGSQTSKRKYKKKGADLESL